MEYPEKCKAAVIHSYNDNLLRAILAMKVEEVDLPVPGPDELVIRVDASPVNPSDIAFLRGGYNIRKSLPAIPGFEGTGIVVHAGGNAADQKGRRVSFFTQEERNGAWSEYTVTSADNCILTDDHMPLDQAACFSVNPFTAFGLMEIALETGAGLIVQNAGGGQVAGFIRCLAEENGMKVINVVRKNDTAKELREAGFEVLVSSEDNFPETLAEKAGGRKTLVLDAVGGEMTGIMLNALPDGSRVVVYGALEGGMVGHIDPMGVIFMDKMVSGFNLNKWRADRTQKELDRISGKLQTIIISGHCKTGIAGTYDLENMVQGIRDYIRNMSAGKILIRPSA